MRKKLEMFVVKLKKYEEKHPVGIILLAALITLLAVGIVSACIYVRQVIRMDSVGYVQFSDKEFEKEVQKLFGKKHFTLTELESISSLEIENNNDLSDISDLVYFSNLTSLSIRYCDISDISVLSGLDKLSTVNLVGNDVSDLNALSNCDNLTELYLGNNEITDITPLYSLSNLTSLMVQQNNISVLEPGMEQMISLNTINVQENRLINIDELAEVENLSYIYASSNKITDTPYLDGMDNLTVLDLGDNAFQELGDIGNLENLQELHINNNYLNNLDVLQSCPNLIRLNLSYNEFDNLNGIEQYQKLQYLDMRGTRINEVSVLSELPEFNTIYVNSDFDRSQLDFMIGNFRNGDTETKQYLLEKQYNL